LVFSAFSKLSWPNHSNSLGVALLKAIRSASVRLGTFFGSVEAR
jgi:hypothetical protein